MKTLKNIVVASLGVAIASKLTSPKEMVFWLLGERAGRTVTGAWHWLWGLPVESGGKLAVHVAEESLVSMQQVVFQLTESVAQIAASYQKAKETYNNKQREFQQTEQQAILAYQNGNETGAQLAMGKAIALERLLPQLAEQVEQAEMMLTSNQERLNRERQRLETYKVEIQNLKDLSEVNEALAAIAKVNTDISTDSALNQFDKAKAAIRGRHQKEKAFADLSDNPTEKLAADLDKMALNHEIQRRMQSLEGASKAIEDVWQD